MEGDQMPTEDSESPTLPGFLSVPGLMAVAIFGILVIVASRLFGPENILREVITELLASFGSTGLLRLLRWAPGGESLSESAERLSTFLQDFDQRTEEPQGSQDGERLDRIEEGVVTLTKDEIPNLKNEIRELQKMLADPANGRRDQALE